MAHRSHHFNVLAAIFTALCLYQSMALLSYAQVDASVLASMVGF